MMLSTLLVSAEIQNIQPEEGMGDQESQQTEDYWLATARMLHSIVSSHSAVVQVSRSLRYETRGRGPTVHGASLRMSKETVELIVGLVLNEKMVQKHGIPSLAQEIRQQLKTAWYEWQPDLPLDIRLDIVDLEQPK